jgi:hypothetical protein
MYQGNTALFDEFILQGRRTTKAVEHRFKQGPSDIVNLLEIQYTVARSIVWLLGYHHLSGQRQTEQAVFSAFHKNLFLFFSALDLTKKGLYGSANSLLRTVYEALLIGKYCSVRDKPGTFEKWASGDHVHVTNEILNRIKKPDIPEMREMWRALNKLAHATIYSQQITVRYEEIAEEIGITLSLIQMLLDCNWHLLNRHWLTPRIVRLTQLYGDKERFDGACFRARELARKCRRSFTKPSKQFVREYTSTWTFNA